MDYSFYLGVGFFVTTVTSALWFLMWRAEVTRNSLSLMSVGRAMQGMTKVEPRLSLPMALVMVSFMTGISPSQERLEETAKGALNSLEPQQKPAGRKTRTRRKV